MNLKESSKEVVDFLKDLITILIIVLIIRTFLIMPFQINWQSMYESYYDKEFIIVDRLTYRIWTPQRWDVVVLKPHVSKYREFFLKRIIWIPWDRLKIEEWKVYVDWNWFIGYTELDEKYLSESNRDSTYVNWSQDKYEYVVPEWKYFVLWDNRNHSTDSRQCFSSCGSGWATNFVKEEDLIWKLFIDLGYFNIDKFSFIQPSLWITTFPRFLSSPRTYDYE